MYPATQIVEWMFACVTRGSLAPGVQRASGRPSWETQPANSPVEGWDERAVDVEVTARVDRDAKDDDVGAGFGETLDEAEHATSPTASASSVRGRTTTRTYSDAHRYGGCQGSDRTRT